MEYPYLKSYFTKDELIEHFTLHQDEKQLLSQVRSLKDKNFLGFAVLLKTFLFLGYSPRQKTDIPEVVVECIALQLDIEPKLFHEYGWKNRVWDRHIATIRKHTGFCPCGKDDYQILSAWLTKEVNNFPIRKKLLAAAVQKYRTCQLELPTEKELQRMVNSSRQKFFDNLYQNVFERLSSQTQKLMEQCLNSSDSETPRYDWIKSLPGPLGMKSILKEIKKLIFIKEFHIDSEIHFSGFSPEILQQLKDRARSEDVFQMLRHPPPLRYSLLAVLLYTRQMEVTDNIVRIFLDLIHRIEKKADKSMEKDLVCNIRKVYGKRKILYKVARSVTENPDGTIREVLFPEIGEEVFQRLIEEFESGESHYDLFKIQLMRKKYSRFYRRMMKPVLDILVFRANNPLHLTLLKGMKLVSKYLTTRHIYYPKEEEIPEDILTGYWQEVVWEDSPKGLRVVKQYFELCVLRKIERALKCKEVWVEGAFRFRNPDQDLPRDWKENRVGYYNKQNVPLKAEDFLDPIREEMLSGLKAANEFFKKKRDVYIYYPGKGERGLFRIPKIQKRPERPILKDIKRSVLNRWGILDLIDILLEADRQVNFSRFFHTSGQRRVLSQEEVRHRLLLTIFSLGTNIGLKRIHSAAKPSCSYDDLLYFRKRFVRAETLRSAIATLVNRILEVRNPRIWGNATTCASDGKHLGAWDQNLIAEWNPHYQRRGVMVYWHVETNATCIYSQLKSCSSSEVAAMIEGLAHHDTEMRIESNFVDSHGQSEVAFPFCRFLMVDLMPRLKRIKYERLYLPDKGMAGQFPNLTGVLSRPIRWDIIHSQYDEMVRHVVAVAEGTGPTESILRRFNSYNRTHPTYKAFIELGKALKTEFLCRVLTRPELRHEIHEGLNVVENWNSSNEFICYGHKMEVQTNDPEMQELTILCLHLLQNALILVNTLMVERVINEESILERMKPEDFRALTPLFTSNVNPYGDFELNLHKPSFLEEV